MMLAVDDATAAERASTSAMPAATATGQAAAPRLNLSVIVTRAAVQRAVSMEDVPGSSGTHTAFVVQVGVGRVPVGSGMEVASWSVTRRYSEFRALWESWCGSPALAALGRATVELPPFPPKRWWVDESVVRERVEGLHVFIAAVVQRAKHIAEAASAPMPTATATAAAATVCELLHTFLLVQEQLGSADDGCGATTAAAGGSNTGGGTAATAASAAFAASPRPRDATSTMLADTVSRVRRNDASLRQLKLPGVLSHNAGGAGAGASGDPVDLCLPNVMDLASALRVNNTLRELDLSGNALGSRGAALILGALGARGGAPPMASAAPPPMVPLTVLKLAGTRLGVDGAALLAGTFLSTRGGGLSTLDISDNSIGDAGLAVVARALMPPSAAARFNIPMGMAGMDMDMGSRGAGAALAGTGSALTSLNVARNGIGEVGAGAAAELLRAGAAAAGSGWSGGGSDGEGVGVGVGLELGEGRAGAETEDTAHAVPSSWRCALRTLNLRGNPLGDAGVGAIAAGLKHSATLTKLSLRDCGGSGAALSALADALATNRTLAVLDLWGNSLAQAEVLPPSALEAAAMSATATATAAHAGGGGGDAGDQRDACALGPLSDALRGNAAPLTALNVGDAAIGEAGAAAIAAVLADDSCTAWRLRTLELWGNGIGAAGAGALAQSLKRNPTLTVLGISDNAIGDAGAATIADALRCGVAGAGDVDVDPVGAAGPGAAVGVAGDPGTGGSCGLRALEMWGNGITVIGAEMLAQAIAPDHSETSCGPNTQLTTLDVRDNRLGAAGVAALASALHAAAKRGAPAALTALNVSGNSVGASGSGPIAELLALGVDCPLRRLEISANAIGAAGAALLAQALTVSTSSTAGGMGWGTWGLLGGGGGGGTGTTVSPTPLSDGDMAHQREYRGPSGLQYLDLSRNSIGGGGARAIAEMLQHNETLTMLSLSDNSIGPEGAVAMAEAVRSNTSLSKLVLRANHIGDKGVHQLMQAVVANASLQSLDVTNNRTALSEELQSATGFSIEEQNMPQHSSTKGARESDKFDHIADVL